VTASLDGTARVWDAATGDAVRVLAGRGGGLTSATFDPSGSKIATRAVGGNVDVWDARSGNAVVALTTASTGPEGTIAWSPDGASITAASSDGWLRCWDATSGRQRFEARGHGGKSIWTASFDPSSSSLVTTGDDLTTRFWSRDGRLLDERRDEEAPVTAAYDASGKRLVSVVSRKRAEIWALDSGHRVPLVGHLGRVTDARWSPDGTWVVTASTDGTARIWDATSGDPIAILPHTGFAVDAASFSADGSHVVLAGDDGVAAIYELPRRAPSAPDLERLLRCRVPFEVRDDRIAPRSVDSTGCAP
jgi:Tol biopolymer transport system component